MVHTNNFTELGIHTSTELHLWISFNILVALSSLIGDTIILVGIIRYKAMKLHKAVVVVIIHLAVSDLLLTTFETVPQIISLFSQGWVLGGVLCLLNPNINIACITATAEATEERTRRSRRQGQVQIKEDNLRTMYGCPLNQAHAA